MPQILEQEVVKLELNTKAEAKLTCIVGVQFWGSKNEGEKDVRWGGGKASTR